MSYRDLYLRFDSETHATQALLGAQLAQDAAGQIVPLPGVAIDVLGRLHEPTGRVIQSPEGQVPEMRPVDGWHVNLRVGEGVDTAGVDAHQVEPTAPRRRWA